MTLLYLGPHNTVKVDVYRPTETDDGVGDITKGWARTSRQIPVVFQQLTGAQAERLFGTESKAKWRSLAEETEDVQIGDVMVVRTGPAEGTIGLVDNVIAIRDRIQNIILRHTDIDPEA